MRSGRRIRRIGLGSGERFWGRMRVGARAVVEVAVGRVQDQALCSVQEEKKTVVVQDLAKTDLDPSETNYIPDHHVKRHLRRMSKLINMIIECCSQERTFLRYYGLVSGRFCLLHERWQIALEEAFATQYNTIHRHLLHTDSISWSVLKNIHLNEDETTSSSRILSRLSFRKWPKQWGWALSK